MVAIGADEVKVFIKLSRLWPRINKLLNDSLTD